MVELFRGRTRPGELAVFHLETGKSVEATTLPRRPFLCGVVLGDAGWSEEWLATVVHDLIEYGAVYLAFHGMRRKEAHDLADQVREQFVPPTAKDVVITTWHDSEPVIEYFWFLGRLCKRSTPG